MSSTKIYVRRGQKSLFVFFMVGVLGLQMGCATHTKTIAGGMLIGSVVGAEVGYQFVHHGDHKQYETRNTIITSVLFALITGGVLAWHYQDIEEMKVELSGRYARYRLCNPDEMQPDLATQLELGAEGSSKPYVIPKNQFGKNAITLDDNTKWVFPSFRKRYLPPDREENQVVSERYIWEIIAPGSFVTRTQNPEYFFEAKEK